ncbi:sacsin N-terminal ATP-binding-like domain-containing protein [Burkholderia ubonensis]|uniref:sacsin N-terminal ATP-binding-like domain-containing protein n=1 Tax=Burkholderia ubonensis TaxID=101571 RepID=UPI000B31176A|nr:DUF3883 domain-containing protein [Burkholderia ubonensis]
MSDADIRAEASVSLEHIAELTGAKFRVFMTEIAEGVSNYRSLHSLTQQVEHQYHGRFLIELIQNAHDAFDDVASGEVLNRVEVVFDLADSEHGTLFVANDGVPFSPSNFERLSQLGQSDKDPQKNIGNKGIGFRSVLEISERPEIFSRSRRDSATFDGYCFRFRPEVVDSIVGPMVELAEFGTVPASPVGRGPLVEWTVDTIAKYRRRAAEKGLRWLTEETRYLSPYLLPEPILSTESEIVHRLESQGFSTVVRLPLKSTAQQAKVLAQISELSARTVIFLGKLGSLKLEVAGNRDTNFIRTSTPYSDTPDATRVLITDSDGDDIEYAVWSTWLHVSDAPESFREAVAALPGRWPEITDIAVSIAVRLGEVPDEGQFSIYLPTRLKTGSAVHINAPFFGDMSRTAIPFDDPYNEQLLKAAAELCVGTMKNWLAGKGEFEARAVIDMLSPVGLDAEQIQRWQSLLDAAAKRVGISIDDAPLVLSETGWTPLSQTSLVPSRDGAEVLTEAALRKYATFYIFHSCLASRAAQIRSLMTKRFPRYGAEPLPSEMASTVANAASTLVCGDCDWNGFWKDVSALLPNGQEELKSLNILLGMDGKLHRANSDSAVFFLRRQGTQDDGDIADEGGVATIPASLQEHVAFLSEKIQTYEASRPTVQTPVRAYLGNGLVSQFRVDSIFSEVLLRLTPKLPLPLDGPHYGLCRDIMNWALRLVGQLLASGRSAGTTSKLLQAIPVPCVGGWFPMSLASFGEGWAGTSGPLVFRYLSALERETGDNTTERLLLHPDHDAWDAVGSTERRRLALSEGGVFDGLRLQPIRTQDWQSLFYASSSQVALPQTVPPSFSAEYWSQYKAYIEGEVRSTYTHSQPYKFDDFHIFPGFREFPDLSAETKASLAEVVLHSVTHWKAALAPLGLTKQGGQPQRIPVTSPLKHFLGRARWMPIAKGSTTEWASLHDRWHVPANTMAGRTKQFSHLKPLPLALAKRLDADSELADCLHSLGLRFLNLHEPTADPGLIHVLIDSIGSDDAPDDNILLGQIRDAWSQLQPPISLPALPMLPVRGVDKQLQAVEVSPASPVYLPNRGQHVADLERFGIPVVAVHISDANRLAAWFQRAYGDGIRLTSTLQRIPMVNGQEWKSDHGVPFADSELAWLTCPLLALVAFYGQARGFHSAAFQDRAERLRTLRIEWVPSMKIAILSNNNDPLVDADVHCAWNASSQSIIATDYCRLHPAELSSALSQAIEREDLELPIRLILAQLTAVDVEPDDIAVLLAPLHVTEEHLGQVREHLRGDIGHMARLVRVLVSVLKPEFDSDEILVARTDEELRASLAAAELSGLDVDVVLRLARENQDIFSFGREVSKTMPERLALPRWNDTLREIGMAPISNREWLPQFKICIENAAGTIKRIVAALIQGGSEVSMADFSSDYASLERRVDLAQKTWEVNFLVAMRYVGELIDRCTSQSQVSAAVSRSDSLTSLVENVNAMGISLDVDPDECVKHNGQLIEKLGKGLEKIRLAWWLKASKSEKLPQWRGAGDTYEIAAASRLVRDGSAFFWTESQVLQLLCMANLHAESPAFFAAMKAAESLRDLQLSLNVSDAELDTARTRLASLQLETIRAKNTVEVCGQSFDSSEDNRQALWTLLQAQISDSEIAGKPPLNLATTVPLARFEPSKKNPNPKVHGASASLPPRRPKSVDELVGLAGEIFVFRMLQAQYGSEVVSASSWISENSKYVFPTNVRDDTRGCDFSFSANGRLFRVEVKATTGVEQTFTLGSSEIRLAMELGKKARRNRERFVLVHVMQALSSAPVAVVLPNPYDGRFSDMFRIVEADARVRYERN